MDKEKIYEEIKAVLLKDENVSEVEIDSKKGVIIIKPNKSRYYLLISDVLKKFVKDFSFVICNKEFVLFDYDLSYDNKMLKIKEVS